MVNVMSSIFFSFYFYFLENLIFHLILYDNFFSQSKVFIISERRAMMLNDTFHEVFDEIFYYELH